MKRACAQVTILDVLRAVGAGGLSIAPRDGGHHQRLRNAGEIFDLH